MKLFTRRVKSQARVVIKDSKYFSLFKFALFSEISECTLGLIQ